MAIQVINVSALPTAFLLPGSSRSLSLSQDDIEHLEPEFTITVLFSWLLHPHCHCEATAVAIQVINVSALPTAFLLPGSSRSLSLSQDDIEHLKPEFTITVLFSRLLHTRCHCEASAVAIQVINVSALPTAFLLPGSLRSLSLSQDDIEHLEPEFTITVLFLGYYTPLSLPRWGCDDKSGMNPLFFIKKCKKINVKNVRNPDKKCNFQKSQAKKIKKKYFTPKKALVL